MRADTQMVTIEAGSAKVFEFVADPANLPRWATGFCLGVRREGERWFVASPQGEVALRMRADAELGVVDFHLSPASGVDSTAASRVVPMGESGCAYVFTFHQAPGMSDSLFEIQRRTLGEELQILKALMEGRTERRRAPSCLPVASPEGSRP